MVSNTSGSAAARIVLIGAGGHAGVVLDALRLAGADVVGVSDPVLKDGVPVVGGLPVLDDAALSDTHPPARFLLANGVGMMPGQDKRRQVYQRMQGLGYGFATVRHPSAVVAETAVLGDGAQIMAGSILQNDAAVGAQTIINTGAQIDHGCRIGALVHICPGAVLSGDVTVEDEVFIGAGAIVVNGVRIGKGAVIGAGAVITRDVPAGTRIVTPASRDLAP